MRIAVINDDMPFLVDSVAATVAAHGPRDRPAGPPGRAGAARCAGRADGAARRRRRRRTARIDDLPRDPADRRQGAPRARARRCATTLGRRARRGRRLAEDARRDARTMPSGSATPKAPRCCAGSTSGMLTQLGHVTRHRDGSQSSVLGICRKSARELLADATLRARLRLVRRAEQRRRRAPLIIKANRLSQRPPPRAARPVHRAAASRTARSPRCRSTPASGPAPRSPPRRDRCRVLRAPARRARRPSSASIPAGHDGKALVHALTALPHDLVIGFSDDDIERVATAMMSLVDRPRPRAGAGRGAARAPPVRVRLAAARHAVDRRCALRIEDLLEEGDRRRGARLEPAGRRRQPGDAALRARLPRRRRHARRGRDRRPSCRRCCAAGAKRSRASSARGEEPARAAALAARYAEAFPPAYRTAYGAGRSGARHRAACAASRRAKARATPLPRATCGSIALEGDAAGPAAAQDLPARRHAARCRTRSRRSRTSASACSTELPTALDDGGEPGHDPRFHAWRSPTATRLEPLLERGEAIEEAIAAVLNGAAEDDVFNRLVVGTGAVRARGRLAARVLSLPAPGRRSASPSTPWSTRCARAPQ